MKRLLVLSCLLFLACATGAAADDITDRWGVGLHAGLYKMVGGENDYANVDQNLGVWLRHGLTPRWSLDVGLSYGASRPGALRGEDAGLTFDSVHAFYTTALHGRIGARHHFAPESRLGPYLSLHAGYIDWRVRDENGNSDVGLMPDGDVVVGYTDNGLMHPLHGQHFTGSLGLGFEYFMSESVSLDLAARYTAIIGNDMDTVGSGNLWGPDHADVNSGILEAFLGLTVYFGGDKDSDGDGFLDADDACPAEAEDFDGFEDGDGCPEADNDRDGIADADDACPMDAEDLDGYKDDDGCPDPDNDGDGVVDGSDGCPDQAEDMDGFEDADGCPDPDNDGDGVLDEADRCPDTPAGVEVDADGCPVVEEIKPAMVLKGVNFRTGSAELMPESRTVLDEVAASLRAYPEATVEIQGHTDSTGSSETNRSLSMSRAESVRQYLIGSGVDPARMTAVGYGEDLPVADNSTREGRAANRRVELVRTDK